MSLNSFIPQMWGDMLLPALRQNLVFGSLVNRDFEGSIRAVGDTVRINAIGDITVSSYTKDTSIGAPQTLSDAQTVLTISQAKYFNFAVDDVDAAQQQPKVMAEAMAWAAYKIAQAIDQYLAGFYTETPTANSIGSTGVPTVVTVPTNTNVGAGTTVYDELMTLAQFLTQNNVPKAGRWVVVPPWCTTLLVQDIRFTSFNTAQAAQNLAQGLTAGGPPEGQQGSAQDAFIGMIGGMRAYESNNAHHIGGTAGASGSQDVILAGHPMAWTYADGVNKVEAYRPPDKFEDAVKGLHLYGAKVTRPYALAAAYLEKP